MSSLIYLVPLALLLGGTALVVFMWSLRNGQYEDLEGAAERIFLDGESDRAGGGPDAPSATEGREESRRRQRAD